MAWAAFMESGQKGRLHSCLRLFVPALDLAVAQRGKINFFFYRLIANDFMLLVVVVIVELIRKSKAHASEQE
jgi:hypothetical protein